MDPVQWKKHHHLVEALGLRIVRGDFKPGDVLPSEASLYAQFGVSRTVLREAISVLAAKGFVEARPKVGTRVRPYSAWNLLDPQVLAWQCEMGPNPQLFRDIAEVRRILEPSAASLAAMRASDEEIARLEACLQRMAQSCEDVQVFTDADREFHLTILLACHNLLLREMTSLIVRTIHASSVLTSRDPEELQRALQRHRAIVEAIRARDPEAAAVASRIQVAAAIENLERALEHAAST